MNFYFASTISFKLFNFSFLLPSVFFVFASVCFSIYDGIYKIMTATKKSAGHKHGAFCFHVLRSPASFGYFHDLQN